jgi:hypothetical protein
MVSNEAAMTGSEPLAALIHDGRHLDGDELGGRAARAATGFSGLGVGPGDAVALLLRNDVAFLEATLALQSSGTTGYPKGVRRHPATPEQRRITDRIRTEVYGRPRRAKDTTSPRFVTSCTSAPRARPRSSAR